MGSRASDAIHCDVAIVGAGPAGSASAAHLARRHAVVLLDRAPNPTARIGESLPPAANRLLADLGVTRAALARAHLPCYGNRSVWGAGGVAESNFLRDPHGPGWHLDRAAFDAMLRAVARDAGARTLPAARLRDATRSGAHWLLTLQRDGSTQTLRARCVIDASGRAAVVARRLGARRYRSGRLVCHWLHGTAADAPHAGLTQVAAAADGWWYSAPLPGARRVLAFHTDADLHAAPRTPRALIAAAAVTPEIAATLDAGAFAPTTPLETTAANGAWCDRVAGDAWLALGDAALSFDPLAAQGLFNALYTALAGAYAVDRHLAGEYRALTEYAAAIERIRHAYCTRLRDVYAQETRWREREFWQRRMR